MRQKVKNRSMGCLLISIVFAIGCENVGIADIARVRELLRERIKVQAALKPGEICNDQELNDQIIRADSHPELVYAEIKALFSSSDVNEKIVAISLAQRLAKGRSDKQFIKPIVEDLSMTLNDPKVGWRSCRFLQRYDSSYFTKEAESGIRAFLDSNNDSLDAVLLVGVADMKDQIPVLKKMALEHPHSGKPSSSVSWALKLALARLGSKDDIAYCIDKFNSCEDMDYLCDQFVHQLGYIRQPEAIKALIKMAKIKKTRYLDGIYVAEANGYPLYVLSDVVKGFPKNLILSDTADKRKAVDWLDTRETFEFNDIVSDICADYL